MNDSSDSSWFFMEPVQEARRRLKQRNFPNGFVFVQNLQYADWEKNNISAQALPFDSPGVGFVLLPRSSGRAGRSPPRGRSDGAFVPTTRGRHERLKKVLVLFNRRSCALSKNSVPTLWVFLSE